MDLSLFNKKKSKLKYLEFRFPELFLMKEWKLLNYIRQFVCGFRQLFHFSQYTEAFDNSILMCFV